jgi:hypothetical protein
MGTNTEDADAPDEHPPDADRDDGSVVLGFAI